MKRYSLRLAGLVFIGVWGRAGLVAAEQTLDSAANDASPVIPGSSMTGYLIWVIFSLLLVVGLIVLLIKWLSQRGRALGTNRALRSLGGIPLGQSKSLQVVELSGGIYTVGVGENIALLDKIDDPEDAGRILEAMEQQSAYNWTPATLTDWIKRLRGRGQVAQSEDVYPQEADSFQALLQNKLKLQSDRKIKVESMLKEQNQNDRLLDE